MSDFDEFSFLTGQHRELALTGPVPDARRLTLPLADGRSLSAIEFADPETGAFGDPRVTLLHGAGLNAHTWDTTVLSAGAPALAIDLPGHGDSSWREDADYTARTLAPDLLAGVRAWTTRPQLIVGQSLGGLSAAAMLAEDPAVASAVIVVDITPGIDPNGGAASLREFFAGPTSWATRDELVERARAFGLGGSGPQTTRGVYLNSRERADGRIEWKHHFAHLAHLLATDAAAAEEFATRGAAVADLVSDAGWADVSAIRCPVTLVVASDGFLTETDVDAFRRHCPQVVVVSVQSGHNVQEQDPAALAALIEEHLAGGGFGS